jgi:hypothetical protein
MEKSQIIDGVTFIFGAHRRGQYGCQFCANFDEYMYNG